MPPDSAPDRLAALREDYRLGGLSEDDADPDPLVMLRRWTDEAIAAGLLDPTAMVLSTVSAAGRPSSRIVLCKAIGPDGLDFYTNRSSRKGEELAARAYCSLVFPWHPLQRQARVEGTVTTVPEEESDAYFASRPRSSQLGAWASPQSRVVGSRPELEARYAEVEARFDGGPVPRPPFWGGYRVHPEVVELWQGRTGRLHDRLVYRPDASDAGRWTVERLAP